MSFTCKKISEPNIDSWGKSQLTFVKSKNFLLVLTLTIPLHKCDSNHEITFFWKYNACYFDKKYIII